MPSPRYASLGIAVQLALAGMLGILVASLASPSPEPVPRSLSLAALFAVPAGIAFIGWRAGRRSLLVAAAVMDVFGAPLSWGGVTLVFLIPAILYLAAAARLPTGSMSVGAVTGGFASAAAVTALGVAAGVVLLTWTKELCWIARSTAGGTSYEIVPTIEGIPISVGESGGCTSAAITIEGAAVAAALAGAAIALAWLAAGGRAGLRTPSAAG